MTTASLWHERYEQYLKSPQWKRIRDKAIDGNYDRRYVTETGDTDRCYSCDCCGWQFKKTELEVHHLHYHAPWGHEKRIDLLVVCHHCHVEEDKKRAARGRERSEEALENSMMAAIYQSYLDTMYGEGYEPDDPEWEYEKFLRWHERKQEY